MDLFKFGLLGMLVLVTVHTSFACQCERTDFSLEGSYCHRMQDQNENTALVKAEVCHKEYDDGHAEHFIVLQEVYLEPRMLERWGVKLLPLMMPQFYRSGPQGGVPTPSCRTIPNRLQQTMLLTSRENRGSACGVPRALNVGKTYIMEVMYTGGHWDITSCAYHKNALALTPAETNRLQAFKNRSNAPVCTTEPPLVPQQPQYPQPQPGRANGNGWY